MQENVRNLTVAIKAFHALLLILGAATALAEQPPPPPMPTYEANLWMVEGAIRSVKAHRDICANAFPDYTETIVAAYDGWRARLKPFLQEIDRHWSALMWHDAKGDAQEHKALLERVEKRFTSWSEPLKDELSKDPQKFLLRCRGFVAWLNTPGADFEHFYAEQVARIRGNWPKRR